MSDATSSTSSPLMFPAFLYGDNASCRRKWKAEGKKWGKRYEKFGTFPEPKLIPIAPGTVVWTYSATADMFMWGSHEQRIKPNWHFYWLDFVRVEASPGLRAENEIFYPRYDSFMCRYPWGALALAIRYPLGTTIPMVIQRLDAVLSFWEPLNTLRFIDVDLTKIINLNDLLYYYCHGFIHTWVENALGRPTREVLCEAVDHMRNASDEEVYAVHMRRLHQLVELDPELKHREWLKTPGLIEAELELTRKTNPEWYANLLTGETGVHSLLLRDLDAKFPG